MERVFSDFSEGERRGDVVSKTRDGDRISYESISMKYKPNENNHIKTIYRNYTYKYEFMSMLIMHLDIYKEMKYLDCPSIPSIHRASSRARLRCNGCITFGIGNINY
jgi:hypothetical protein